MGSLFRAVRATLRYRFTLAAGVFCSLAIGVLWGANIGTLYPFMEVVFRGESLQQSVDNKIAVAQENCRALSATIEELQRRRAGSAGERKTEHDVEIATHRARLAAELGALTANQRYKPYLDRYCPRDPFLTLVVVMVVLLLGTMLKDAFLVANTFLTARVVQLTVADLQNRFFCRTLRQDLAAFHQHGTSSFVGRFVNEMRMVACALEAFLGAAIREPLKMVACLVGAAMISWRLLLLSMICAPVGILLLQLLSKTIKRATQHSLDLLTEQIRRLTESYGGFVTVKAFTMERQERSRFRYVTREMAWMAQKITFLFSLSKPVTEVMAVGITTVAILAGTYLVLHRETHLLGIQMTSRPLDPAALMVFFGLLAGMADPARKLSGIFGQIYMGVTAAKGIYGMMDRPTGIKQSPNAVRFRGLERDLAFESLHFAYQPGEPVLEDVNLQIRAGERVALVGPNGCGKSTLVKLLLRFYDPTAGRVCLDGVDLRQCRLRDVRRHIGLVTQETWLFDDTIAGNIRCAKPDASDEEVVEAARKAHAHRFIAEELAQGYQTRAGQCGSRLSGGQRQRIALARVILRNPSILILDEATSEIDLESERLIHETLAEFMQDRTAIMITHRLSALALADRIVVFDHGRILDVGSGQELESRCEVFNRLVTSQIRSAA